jgi:general secretion pathway protein J
MMRRGFSMLEILIAAGLMGIMGALMVTSLSSSMDVKEAVENASDQYHLVRQGMSRMVREISMAYLSTHRNALEPKAETHFRGESDQMHFVAMGHVVRQANAKESDQHELSYFLGPDDRSGEQAILRRSQPNPDVEYDEGGRTQVLCYPVTDLIFSYWDRVTEDWKESWDTEEVSTLNRLPDRVRIEITMKMADGTEQTFMSQSKILMTKPLRL